MTAADYAGIGALITSTGAAITGIVVAFRQQTTHAKLDTVQREVKTSNGETLGQIIEANDLRALGPNNGH